MPLEASRRLPELMLLDGSAIMCDSQLWSTVLHSGRLRVVSNLS